MNAPIGPALTHLEAGAVVLVELAHITSPSGVFVGTVVRALRDDETEADLWTYTVGEALATGQFAMVDGDTGRLVPFHR